jgi:hypothetical protein
VFMVCKVCVGACCGFGVWVVWGGWGCWGRRGWLCGGSGGVGVWSCGGVMVWGVGVWGCGGCGGCGGVGVWGCGGVGWFPLAFEHSKVCTLCDFGHLQFLQINSIIYITILFRSKHVPHLDVDDFSSINVNRL